jgi:tRNA-splicing ligase RtcB
MHGPKVGAAVLKSCAAGSRVGDEGFPLEMAPQRRMKVPVRVYASRRLAPPVRAVAVLERIAALDVVAEAVVALPDLHHKPQLECPSSVATATRDHIVLALSSPSPNCGMALARTALRTDDADDVALDALFGELARRLSLTRRSPILSPEEVADVMLRGAAAAVERYGLDPSTADYMDQRGNALPPGGVDAEAVLATVPRPLWAIGGWEFALVGKGNHFLELQAVDALCDEETARAWGLSRGQVVAMYHADSGRLGAFVGRLYAHRRKNTWQGRLHEWRVKLPFHLFSGSPGRALQRLNYHLLPRWLAPMPIDSEEGQRALLAFQAASNYAYANRLAVLATLRDAMRAVWGEGCAPPALLWDAPHNSIRRETVDGQDLWVHRHNAARVLPPSHTPTDSPFARTGQPVLLPGMDRTSSYLCAAGEGAACTLYSVAHGAGRSATQLGYPLNDGPATRLYTYEDGPAEIRPHLSDDGLEEVLEVLQTHDTARPVARLRPLAVLKSKGSVW